MSKTLVRECLVVASVVVAGCHTPTWAEQAEYDPQTPPNAHGLFGTVRFQLDGVLPTDAELSLPEGVRVVGEFAWSEAQSAYWPMLVAYEPGSYDLALHLHGLEGPVDAVGTYDVRLVDALALDTAAFRADGGLVRATDLYAAQQGAIPHSVPLQLVDADDVALWGTEEVDKLSDPAGLLYADLDTVYIEAGHIDFPADEFDVGDGQATFELDSGEVLSTPYYHRLDPDDLDDRYTLSLVLGPPSPRETRWSADTALIYVHVDSPSGDPVLVSPPLAQLSGHDPTTVGLSEDAAPCGWVFSPNATAPVQQVPYCVGAQLCTVAALNGTVSPAPEDSCPDAMY